MKLSEIEIAYIAGFVDGEGSIAIHRQRNNHTRTGYAYRCGVRVANTWESPLRWMQEATGLGVVHSHQAKMRNSKVLWNWSLWSDHAAGFVSIIRPFLRVRAEQADLLLKFQARVKRNSGNLSKEEWDFRQSCYHESRRLNNRGLAGYMQTDTGTPTEGV